MRWILPLAALPALVLWAAALGALLPSCSDGARAAPPRFRFQDRAAEAGLVVRNASGDPRRWYIPESQGCGAAWIDYDGDSDLDLFVANGQGLRYLDDGARLEVVPTASCRLYANEGNLRFADVTEEAGAEIVAWVNAVSVADVEGDGDPDLYLACFGRDVFLRNDGGKFVDATDEAGLGCELWGAAATFGDVDRDGDLDLYVANYVLFDTESPPNGGKRNIIEGVQVGWGPEAENGRGFNKGSPDVFYLGDGEGKFTIATNEAGLVLDRALCSYAAVFSDVDRDGWPDLLVANDMQPANLFINKGDGRFSDEALERGFAFDASGNATSAMGLLVEDVDADGDMDVLRTNFDFEPNSLHLNDGRGFFRDESSRVGLGETSVDRLSWGGGFFDADLDGDLDLLVANGHVYPQAEQIGMNPWLQISQFYESSLADRGVLGFIDATAAAGPGLAMRRSARGVAMADADNDGDIDAVIVDIDEVPRLLENRSPRRGRWISVRLAGAGKNKDGIGALVTVEAGGREQVREMRRIQGLYSSHDPRLHFGLGHVDGVESVKVRWPSGAEQVILRPRLESVLTIEEPVEAPR